MAGSSPAMTEGCIGQTPRRLVSRGDFKEPAVIGAVFDLRNCFDLVARENLEMLKDAHVSFRDFQEKSGYEIPKNLSAPKDRNLDRVLRYLDCAVIKHFHTMAERSGLPKFDTVRGMFSEGAPLYEGSGFKEKNHVQIAVRTDECILGVFHLRPSPAAAEA